MFYHIIYQEINALFMGHHQQPSCYVHSHSGFDFHISEALSTQSTSFRINPKESWDSGPTPIQMLSLHPLVASQDTEDLFLI